MPRAGERQAMEPPSNKGASERICGENPQGIGVELAENLRLDKRSNSTAPGMETEKLGIVLKQDTPCF